MNKLPNSNDENQKFHRSIILSALLFGLGFGGFFDGIVLHQILQWHHMLTNAGYSDMTVAELKVNTVADGLFHAGTYVFTVSGLLVLWRALERGNVSWSSHLFGGGLLMGAGLFNLIEGIIDHHILGIHHVKSGPNQLAWDLGFLAVGGILVLIGWVIMGREKPSSNLGEM